MSGIECVNIVTDDHNSTVMHHKRWKELLPTCYLKSKLLLSLFVYEYY